MLLYVPVFCYMFHHADLESSFEVAQYAFICREVQGSMGGHVVFRQEVSLTNLTLVTVFAFLRIEKKQLMCLLVKRIVITTMRAALDLNQIVII